MLEGPCSALSEAVLQSLSCAAVAVLLSLSAMCATFIWYNIGWAKSRFHNLEKHENELKRDLHQAINDFAPSGIFLSECGEVGEGLPAAWHGVLTRILPAGFYPWVHSHYTCILNLNDVDVVSQPALVGPMCTMKGHEYRKCQRVEVALKGNAAKPIVLYNVHSPASKKHPLGPAVREQIMDWFGQRRTERALIGGDLNMSPISLHEHLDRYRDFSYCFEENHEHGDVVLAKKLPEAESLACAINRTSDTHRMCVVTVPRAAKPPPPPPPPPPPSCASQDKSAAKPAAEAAGGSSKATEPAEKKPRKETADETMASATRDGAGTNSAAKPATPGAGDGEQEALPQREGAAGAGTAEKETPVAEDSESQTPLVDMLFRAVGQRMDASAAERKLFGQLAANLWNGSFTHPPRNPHVADPRCAKQRLETMLQKVLIVREKYQKRAQESGTIKDGDIERSLTEDETKIVHNLYMNDVEYWMTPEVAQKYYALIAEADEEDRKAKGKGKNAGGQKGKGKSKRSAEKPGERGPRQEAQQLKKQRFNKVLNDYAASKAFFMTLVKHPRLMKVEHLVGLVNELKAVKETPEYEKMVKVSEKKTNDEKRLKRERDAARVELNRGRAEYQAFRRTKLAKQYDSGELLECFVQAQNAWNRVKQTGVAVLLGAGQSY